MICHGYVLKGTGSNQYVQSFARSLCGLGNDVVIICQDMEPDLDFVSSYVREQAGVEGSEVVWERRTVYPGSCTVYRPGIGGFLPVYVLDSYPGFEKVRIFPDLNKEELDVYVETNRAALHRVVETFVPEVIHVNHAVMLPYVARPVAAACGLPYFVTIHGSAIEFTVKRDERFLRYGAEGLSGAEGIIVPSGYTAGVVQELFSGLVDRLDEKISVVPPGVDTSLFHPRAGSTSASVEKLIGMVHSRTGTAPRDPMTGESSGGPACDAAESVRLSIERINAAKPDWLPDPDLDTRLRELAGSEDQFMMFVGKLLETKGVQCAIAAMPLILGKYPRARLVLVGFGELRGILELMVEALNGADLDYIERLCVFGNKTYDRCPGAFEPVRDFLRVLVKEGAMDDYRALCTDNDLCGAVTFTGYLTQGELSNLLPHASALLVPSLSPEAFGLVATEGMACGVVPVASRHSGLLASISLLESELGEKADLLILDDSDMVNSIFAAACEILGESKEALLEMGARLSAAVEERFSWDAMAESMVSLFNKGSS